MSITKSESRITVNIERLANVTNIGIYFLIVGFFLMGYFYSFYFHFGTVGCILLAALNVYYLHVQTEHALLSNFGFLAQLRYILESVGPEFRQYLYMSDTEERPFNRLERAEVYRKSKDVDSSSAFGSLTTYGHDEIKLRHSMYPIAQSEQIPFSLTFGEERNCSKSYTITRPFIISGMSYGALSDRAVRALARGAYKADIPMNTGEGGFPKYHLMENCDLIFQMGTAKFGVRNDDSSLNEEKLKRLVNHEQVKMIEIKLSQGAKPGKGGLLPKEKITQEIAELRGVPMGADVLSPPSQMECINPDETVKFIKRVQEISEIPTGIKLCIGRLDEFKSLVDAMIAHNIFPDYISIDGAEGGTGAAPRSFMDDVGVPIYTALPEAHKILLEAGVRNRLKLLAAGKLIDAGRHFVALSLGADAVYIARGFLFALGCLQSLQCNNNTCPVGITTHDKHLKSGLDIEQKSERTKNYAKNLWHDHQEILAAMGKRSHTELDEKNLFIPKYF